LVKNLDWCYVILSTHKFLSFHEGSEQAK
jgi:hypothetical protein